MDPQTMESEISLEIILVQPTPGVVFGLQEGSGSNYKSVQKQMATDSDLTFRFTIIAKGDKNKDVLPRLSGNVVQGPPASRFIYIDIGTYAGQSDSIWGRRLKIPLTGITWQVMNSLPSDGVLKTSVPGTGKDGGPNCATVKPFDGWHLKK